MLPKDYIISELKSFINDFPKTRVRYEHDNSSDTHFIEIVPNEIYHLDTQYMQWESEMFDRFVSVYPEENICFISDDALVGLDNIEFEICGIEFVSTYSTVNSQITVLLENHINVSSAINNDTLFSVNICPNLFHSNQIETNYDYFQSNKADENTPNFNLPLAA